MSGRKTRTNRFLLLAAVILCLAVGVFVPQSLANHTSGQTAENPDMFVAKDAPETPVTNLGSETKTNAAPKAEETPTAAPTETPAPEPEDSSQTTYKVSPEAEKGVWRPNGSSWTFLVDGVPHTGWLYDTDGHRYFFNSDGIMQTGVVDYENKRYYFDEDGIMQTGDVTLKGKTYHFLDDGSLEGFTVKAPADTKTEKTTKTPAPSQTPAKAKPAGTIALTFDDGPGEYTGRLLDCLEANNAKATFFLVGQEISKYPDEVKRMSSLGCELGGHSYTHIDMTTLSADDILAEIWATEQEILNLTGKEPTALRPPYGNIDDNVTAYADNPIILWSVDTLDWETKDAELVTKTVLENAQDGAIILLHDIHETTVAAAEVFIPKLIEQGYQLVTVHELAAAHNTELQNGVSYNSMKP